MLNFMQKNAYTDFFSGGSKYFFFNLVEWLIMDDLLDTINKSLIKLKPDHDCIRKAPISKTSG